MPLIFTLGALHYTTPPGAVTVLGYGSNMSPEGMASKGLKPLHSSRAILKDWKLSFNMRYIGLCDPAMAYVEPCPGAVVHGIATTFTATDLEKLDIEEVRRPPLESVDVLLCLCPICYSRVGAPRRDRCATTE